MPVSATQLQLKMKMLRNFQKVSKSSQNLRDGVPVTLCLDNANLFQKINRKT